MKRLLLIPLLAIVGLTLGQSQTLNISDSLKSNGQIFKFHNPKHSLRNPINHFSFIHFIEYGFLSLLKFIQTKHMWLISIGWEIIELFIPNDWARESWANKLCDLFFNWLGFYIVRRLLYQSKYSFLRG